MNFVLKYGFHTPNCDHVYISDELDIKKVAKLIMEAEEILEYTVDDEITDDGEEHFWIKYRSSGWSYECRKKINVTHLIEINGKMFELPPWGIYYRAIKITSETPKSVE